MTHSPRVKPGRLKSFLVPALAAVVALACAPSRAQLCKGNLNTGCTHPGAACSPVDIGSGDTGRCVSSGVLHERECDCVGKPVPPPPQPMLEFVITTGGDDLRGDSSATAALFADDGSKLQTMILKSQNEPGWGNNSVHVVDAPLSTAYTQIGSIVITLTSHNGIFETNDNWNIQRVVVSTRNIGPQPKRLLTASGAPFVRLTGDEPSVTLPLVPMQAAPLCPSSGCAEVATYHNDKLRTGWNPAEVSLNPGSVGTSPLLPPRFGQMATMPVDDQVDTQPLFVDQVLYVATENNTVYAANFATGSMRIRHLGTPVHTPLGCGNNGPNVGINGTPVIDSAAKTMFVDVYTTDSGSPQHLIHALDLASLDDKPSSPVTVKATGPLQGGGSFAFNASFQRQRPGLLLNGNTLYAGYGSFCDFGGSNSRGWLLGWSESSLAPLAHNRLNDELPSANEMFLSSIWMAGYGVAADAQNSLYFVTGNTQGGTYDSFFNIAESAVKVAPDLSQVQSFFTPSNVGALDGGDVDFGSGGLMLLPDQPGEFPHLAAAAGKDGRMFILNRDRMGGINVPDEAASVPIGECWCGPSYFETSDTGGKKAHIVSSGGNLLELWKLGPPFLPGPVPPPAH